MALITFEHAPKFVSFDFDKDMDLIVEAMPYEARVLQNLADKALHKHVSHMHKWCHEHCTGKYSRYWRGNDALFRFEQLEDALLFKLIWA